MNDLAIQAGVLFAAAIGDAHEGAVIQGWHLELGAILGVDLVLVNLYVHLAHRAGGDDHLGAAIIGGLDNIFYQGPALFRFRKR